MQSIQSDHRFVAEKLLRAAIVILSPIALARADDPVFSEAISPSYTIQNHTTTGFISEAVSQSLSAHNHTTDRFFGEAHSQSLSGHNRTTDRFFGEAFSSSASAHNRTTDRFFAEVISPSATACNFADVPDTDDDGVNDCADNCPEEVNPKQGDLDGDGIGNVCDDHIGDMNCSGSVDFDDIDGFVTALISRDNYVEQFDDCNWFNGDIDRNCSVDFDDIDYFVVCLINSGCE